MYDKGYGINFSEMYIGSTLIDNHYNSDDNDDGVWYFGHWTFFKSMFHACHRLNINPIPGLSSETDSRRSAARTNIGRYGVGAELLWRSDQGWRRQQRK